MTNLPFTKDEVYDGFSSAVDYGLAQFIGWQGAVAKMVISGEISSEAGLKIVGNAGENIHKLMTFGGLPVGDKEVTLNNELGEFFGRIVERDLEGIARTLEMKLASMEVSNAA